MGPIFLRKYVFIKVSTIKIWILLFYITIFNVGIDLVVSHLDILNWILVPIFILNIEILLLSNVDYDMEVILSRKSSLISSKPSLDL